MRYRTFLFALTSLAVIFSLVAADVSPDLERIETLRAQIDKLNAAQKFTEAITPTEELLALRRKVYGSEHADVARSLAFLGYLNWRAGNLNVAERFTLEGLAMRRKILPPADNGIVDALCDLARIYAARRTFADAATMMEEAFALSRQSAGDDNERTGLIRIELADYRWMAALASGFDLTQTKDSDLWWRTVGDATEGREFFTPGNFPALSKALDELITHYPKDPRRWDAKLLQLQIEAVVAFGQRANFNPETQRRALQEIFDASDATAKARSGAGYILLGIRADSELRDDASVARWIADAETMTRENAGDSRNEILNLQLADHFRPRDAARARALYTKLAKSTKPTLRQRATQSLAQMELAEKPIELEFVAADGKPFDVKAWRGKIVLMDFWASWCPPCVRSMPEVVETYRKFHERGFEIVGISLDREKDKMLAFTKDQGMTWPQLFVPEGGREIVAKFGITAIPRMWLFDRTGRFVTADVHANLAQQVEQLLAKDANIAMPADVEAMGNRAMGLFNKRDFRGAIDLLEKRLQRIESSMGKNSPNAAVTLGNLAAAHDELHEFTKAQERMERAVAIIREVDPRGSRMAAAFHNLGIMCERQGNYRRAAEASEESIKLHEQIDPNSALASEEWCILGRARRHLGDYASADEALRRSRDIAEKLRDKDPLGLAAVVNEQAVLASDIGNFPSAERLFQDALRRRESASPPDEVGIARTSIEMADFYTKMADLAKAEPFYQRALEIHRRVLGPEHRNTGATLGNLGGFYLQMGDLDRAEVMFRDALRVHEKAVGIEHQNVLSTLGNLAVISQKRGDFAEAEILRRRALDIARKIDGGTGEHTANALLSLAALKSTTGKLAEALTLGEEALKIATVAYGSENPALSGYLNNYGLYLAQDGSLERADALLRRALALDEKAFGSQHPHTYTPLGNLATIALDRGFTDEALSLSDRAISAESSLLANVLSFASAEQRAQFKTTMSLYPIIATIGDAARLAQTVLRFKGVVLDSVLEDHAVALAASSDAVTWRELQISRQQLMRATLEPSPAESAEARAKRDTDRIALTANVEKLESSLARKVNALGRTRRAFSVTVEQVQAALRANEVLVEIVGHGYNLGHFKLEQRYGAVVIPPHGDPRWVPLGAAASIDKLVARHLLSARGKTDETTLHTTSRELYDQMWAPISAAFPSETRTVVLSPDDDLSFLAFSTLLDAEDRFVAERFAVRYVASGRDLLRENTTTTSKKMIVCTNPDFKTAPSPPGVEPVFASLRSTERGDLSELKLAPLPGTAREGALLAALASRNGLDVSLLSGAEATETSLKTARAPRVLHLATHGFFLPETSGDLPSARLRNPMHRSGLALAGAQRTIERWVRGEVPPLDNDGILTAEEVASLPLDGTWLVTLSACDTGGGEARAGEGVLGLRRGFIQAGAQNLLMTLWPISDETTVEIMLDFYARAFKSGDAPGALAETQRDWLVKLRKEKGLLHAVNRAGAFIMSSQGKIRPVN